MFSGCHFDLTYVFFGVMFSLSPAKINLLRTSSMNLLNELFKFVDGVGDWIQNFRPRPSVFPMPKGGDDVDRQRLW